MQTMKNVRTVIFLLLACTGLRAQDAGVSIVRNYTVEEFRAGQQSWTIRQDRNGLIYVGNTDGLLQCDGVSWRLTRMPILRSMAVDTSGIIYVGLENDIGYVEPDEKGNLLYHSLKEQLPEEYREITPVFKTHILNGNVYYMNDDKLMIYRDGRFRIMPARGSFHLSLVAGNRYFIREWGSGLWELQGDSLVWVDQSERFANERIYVMFPYGRDEFLLITRNEGVWIFSPTRAEKFRQSTDFKEISDFLIRNWPYCGTLMPNGDYAVGTIDAGVILFDATGTIKHRFSKQEGLQDNTVYDIIADQHNQLWVTLDNGISRIENNLPFTIYSSQSGIEGTPMCIKFHQGILYVGTSRFLHILNEKGYFEKVEGTLGQNFDLCDVDGTLLLARNPGIVEVMGRQVRLVANTDQIPVTVIRKVMGKPHHLLVGGDVLYLLEKRGNEWTLKHPIRGFNLPVYAIEEDGMGNTWVSTGIEFYRLKFNPALDSVVFAERYKPESGLPSDWAWPFKLNSGEVVFGTLKGIYRYDQQSNRFEPHPDFRMFTGKMTMLKQMENGDIWFDEQPEPGNSQKGLLHHANGQYTLFKTPFYKYAYQGSVETPNNIAIADDGTVFTGMPLAILQYKPEKTENLEKQFMTLIRRVTSKDSVLYGGYPNRKIIREGFKSEVIDFTGNDITIEYSATFFENAEKNRFSYRLLGSDTTWSEWTPDHKKEYSNLPPGSYTFEVRSINQYQTVGSSASFPFTITPPWYRTWLAYLSYVLLAGILVYTLVWMRTRKLRARSRELERMVEDRTAEIKAQKNNVEQLSRIGKDITSSLSIGNIIRTVYENVNTLMDASVFSIGLHNPETGVLEFPAGMEKGKPLPPFNVELTDEHRLAAWCFTHRQEVVINDYNADYSRYVGQQSGPLAGESPESILYLPLWSKEKVIGVITAQSFSKNAYSDYQLNILRNLATYSAIALENADAYRRLATLIDDLKATQDKLVTQSKLAALGALTAGIAHEIKNPLNFVTNFASLSVDLVEELRDELNRDIELLGIQRLTELEEILSMLKQNASKVQEHGKRADSIVKSMLQHSRGSTGDRQPTDVNAMLEEVINLTYHGMRAQDSNFNIRIEKFLDESIGRIDAIPQELSRAFLNIITNACYEANRHKHDAGSDFMPTLTVTSQRLENQVKVSIRDNGNGIPEEVRTKLFTPFFTTKPAGQGTGLGLSITWDIIVHQHNGQISFDTRDGEFTEFVILLPG
jgi:signal transduction histidine kinase/ligand-binding sensor domain-containing protein